MRLIALVALLSVCVFASTSHAVPAHLWSQHYGDLDDQTLNACFPDPSGNVIICGSFRTSIDIVTPYTVVGSRDVIVAKFAPNGTPLWDYRVGFPFADTGFHAVADYSGNIIVGGSIGPTEEERHAFIARLSPGGTQQWIKYFPPSSGNDSYVYFVATDSQKNIFATGLFQGSINLGGGVLTASSSEGDMFLAKFDALGNHLWSKRFGTFGATATPTGLGVDPADNVVLFGGFDGTLNLGGGILTSPGLGETFLAEYNTNGGHMWSKRFGSAADDYAAGADIDPSGRIALTGAIWGPTSFGGPTLMPNAGPDIFLALLETDGDHIWSKVFGAGDREEGLGVAFASNNDVLLTAIGNGTDEFTFGGDLFSGQADYGDLYVARFFGSNGDHRWSTRFYGPDGFTEGLVDEVDGQLILGGGYQTPLDLGGGPMSNAGDSDIFIALFADHLTGAAPLLAPATLKQNSPNPFNPTTRIEYSLASSARVVIEIVDASGAVVARLDQGDRQAGANSATWNGRDAKGRAVASGVYFYRLAGMSDVPARKMVLLK